MTDLTKCPMDGCGWSVRDPDVSVRQIAVRSHLKSHPRAKGGPSKGRDGSRWTDTVADIVGDAVEGALGALGKLFD